MKRRADNFKQSKKKVDVGKEISKTNAAMKKIKSPQMHDYITKLQKE